VKLFDLIDYELLDEMIREGYIRERRSPDGDLTLLNYTEKAQFDRVWNAATMNSRGLIFKTVFPHEIVARPFFKFFNYGEGLDFSLEEPVVVTDKVDGSLGILYKDSSGMNQIATRGSFESDQALHASHVLNTKYAGFEPKEGWTYLFEIVYPENRIVVDYGDTDDLILLGAVHIESGSVLGPDVFLDWPGPHTEVFGYRNLREALSAPLRPGKEGLVVRSVMDDAMVKIKQEDYVSLHRVVTGLNEREIWRRARDLDLSYDYLSGDDFASQVINEIPDELHDWVVRVSLSLRDMVYNKLKLVNELFAQSQVEAIAPGDEWKSERGRKKAFALWLNRQCGLPLLAQKNETNWLKKAMFIKYDGGDPRQYLWRLVEPKGDVKK
jgi:RNA ligase